MAHRWTPAASGTTYGTTAAPGQVKPGRIPTILGNSPSSQRLTPGAAETRRIPLATVGARCGQPLDATTGGPVTSARVVRTARPKGRSTLPALPRITHSLWMNVWI